MHYTKEELCYIWVDSFIGLEYKNKVQIYNYIVESDGIANALKQAKSEIVQMLNEQDYSLLINSANKQYLNFVIEGLESAGVVAVTLESETYPEVLSYIDCPPLVLYAKGDVGLLNGKNFAIVGSRKSLPISLKIAENYTKALASVGYTLVTGIAEGVDSVVLTSAFDSGASAISVIAGGINHVYPASNVQLLEKVASTGLVISEFPPSVVPKPYHFPVRNRIISALSRGVLIVSGAKKSGTLYTAEYAEEYGKDLFVIPYSVGVESGMGCNDLIKRGAMLTDTPQDILDFYGEEKAEQIKVEINPEEREIIKALSDGEKHIEKLSEILKKRTFELVSTLSLMEIKGIIAKSTNVYSLTGNYLEE